MTIEVADRGCGLPADLGERIFEPFVSTKEGGTGLGLPICKRIIEEHGGEITANSGRGRSCVYDSSCRSRRPTDAPVVSVLAAIDDLTSWLSYRRCVPCRNC